MTRSAARGADGCRERHQGKYIWLTQFSGDVLSQLSSAARLSHSLHLERSRPLGQVQHEAEGGADGGGGAGGGGDGDRNGHQVYCAVFKSDSQLRHKQRVCQL